jgi:hypothetical protein
MPVVPQSGGGGLAALLKMLGVQMPPPVPAETREPWQDMPGSGPKPVADAVLGALTDFPKGMVTGGAAQPGPSWENAGAVAAAVMALGPLLGKIVYHGSPHVFDKFDMSKIGTGEGAQAYGHGLYFADSKGVADSYRKELSGPGRLMIDGWPVDKTLGQKPILDKVLSAFDKTHSQPTDADALRSLGDEWMKEYHAGTVKRDSWNQWAKAFEDVKPRLTRAKDEPGALYNVDLPDEAIANMLDWDAPLSQQPEAVRKAFAEVGVEASPVSVDPVWGKSGSDPSGQELYRMIERRQFKPGSVGRDSTFRTAGPEAAKALREKGVPGIRYFDGSSRGKGEGSRNYVVFDDQLPKIVKVER